MKRVGSYAAVGLDLLTTTATFAQQNAQELDCVKLMAEEAVLVDTHGPAGKTEIVENTAESPLDDYTMEDVKFLPISSRSGVLIHKMTDTGTSRGKQFMGKVHISNLYNQEPSAR